MKSLKIVGLLAATSMLDCFARSAAAAEAEPAAVEGTEAEASQTGTKRQVTISGESFEIAVPYAVGHQLNEAEASVLNQTYLENIRNNVAGKIKAAKEAQEKSAPGTAFSIDSPIGGEGPDATKTLRQVCSEYAESYEFGVRTARNAEPVDPVEREARVIAREAINAKLKAGNVKRKDVSDEAYEQALTKLAATQSVIDEAKRRVEVRSSIGLEELGLTASPATEGEGAAA